MFLNHFQFTSQPFAERVSAAALWQGLLQLGADRKTVLVAVGGGVSVLFRKNISAFLRYGLDYVPRDTAHTLGAGVTIGF